MPKIRRRTIVRHFPFIMTVIREPPEKWDAYFTEAFNRVHLRVVTRCDGAEEDLKELGEITSALRATDAYQNRAK